MSHNPINFGALHCRIINELPKVFKALQDAADMAHAAGEQMPHLYFRLEFLGMVNGESGVAGLDVTAIASPDFLTVAAADGLAPQIEAALNILVAAEQEAMQNPLPLKGDDDEQEDIQDNPAAAENGNGNPQLH